jgi:hypothetical protein
MVPSFNSNRIHGHSTWALKINWPPSRLVNFIAGNGDLFFPNVMIEAERIGEARIIVLDLQKSLNCPRQVPDKNNSGNLTQ